MYIFIWNKAISFQLTVPTWATSSRRPRHMPAHTHPWCVYIFKFLLLWADNRQLNGPGQSGSAWAGAIAAAIATAIAITQISPSGEYYTTSQHRRCLNQKRNWGKLQTQDQVHRIVLARGVGTMGRRRESDKLMRALRKWQSAPKNTDCEWTKLGKTGSSWARKGLVRENERGSACVCMTWAPNTRKDRCMGELSNWTNSLVWLRPGLKICPRPLASRIGRVPAKGLLRPRVGVWTPLSGCPGPHAFVVQSSLNGGLSYPHPHTHEATWVWKFCWALSVSRLWFNKQMCCEIAEIVWLSVIPTIRISPHALKSLSAVFRIEML